VPEATVADHGRGTNLLGGPVSALRHLVDILSRDQVNPPLAAGAKTRDRSNIEVEKGTSQIKRGWEKCKGRERKGSVLKIQEMVPWRSISMGGRLGRPQ